MGEPQKRENLVDKTAYDVAIKITQKVIETLVDKVIEANGIPIPMGGPIKKFYSEYAKKIMELYLSQRKIKDIWTTTAALRSESSGYLAETKALVANTNVPSLPQYGPVTLFAALLDPAVARQYESERGTFQNKVIEVVRLLDARIEESGTLFEGIESTIRWIDKFEEEDVPRNIFESSLNKGMLATARRDLCFSAEDIAVVGTKLRDHRNEWAALVGIPSLLHTNRSIVNFNCPYTR